MTEIRPFESRNIGDWREVVRLAEAFLVQEVPRPQFLTFLLFALLTRCTGGRWANLGDMEVSGTHLAGKVVY